MGKAGISRIVECFALVLFACLLVLPAAPANATTLTGGSSESLSGSQTTDKVSVQKLTVSSIPTQYYNGRAHKPKPIVKYGSKTLQEGTDYVLQYKNNVRKGTATVILTGKGGYTGSRNVTFQIAPKTRISNAKVLISKQGYTGKALTPTPLVILNGKVLKAGTDFSVKYKNNVRKGTATVILTGKGGYTGKARGKFKIVAKTSILKTTVSTIGNQVYAGAAITPKPRITYGGTVLREGVDYTLSYKKNANVGIAAVTITGKNLYSGSRLRYFKITPCTMSKTTVSAIGDKTFTGAAFAPKPTVKLGKRVLVAGSDYTLSYKNNVNAGTATVTITGKKNFSGTKSVTFKIVPAKISAVTVAAISNQLWTNSAITPKPTVKMGSKTLSPSGYYTLSYKNNVNIGTATVVITGKGNLSGSRSVSFKVVPNISKATVSTIGNKTFTGAALAPKPTVKMGSKTLVAGTDYTLSYKNNVNAGTATVTITGKGASVGTRSITFKIVPVSISSASISDIPDKMNTGKPLTPKPKVKMGNTTLAESSNYTLSYKNNVNIGRATVTVTGKGNYSGSVSVGFNIVAPFISGIEVSENRNSGGVMLKGVNRSEFNKLFSYGDSLDVEFSNGFTLSSIPYYNGWYAERGTPLVVSYADASDPIIATNYGDRMWDIAGLSKGDTVTIRLAGRGTYSSVQNALNITYSNNRSDYSSDESFANFRQVVGGRLSGNLYRSASPICNWWLRAPYASSLAESVGIAFVLNLSDSNESIEKYIINNNNNGVDVSYYESLYTNGQVLPLNMNNSYTTQEYQTKIAAGLTEMAHRDGHGPYLVHCVEGKDRTGFTCLLLASLAEASYDEMLADYMATYANYCGITYDGTPEKYQAVKNICFDSMVDFLMNSTSATEGDYAGAARAYLIAGGMSSDDVDLLIGKLTIEN